ncbi:TIGR01777 family protein [Williamsia sp. 1138]|uniref:TIGR01777 family oxidoreductase n=1 Tax=Williamsia sp. 1138 TaxID=1903117 RepID=UPI000A0F437F|nr:TIGR01777 family oxidoreductase [Williamsia sp. 1138]OZG28383.1 TIGR01777 family protein [Williamsia sp. 1138]
MRIAVAGSSGLIGTALVDSLTGAGHQVLRLVRRPTTSENEVHWEPESFGIDPAALSGVDVVVNLCGRGIGDRRWSGHVKQQLRDSRIIPTQVLAEAVRIAAVPTFISSSATGYYGDTGSSPVTEADAAGTGFLADLTIDWEAAALSGAPSATRVALIRTAPVLSQTGGILGKLRPLFKVGLGGRLGSGRQYLPWISLPDAVRVLEFVMDHPITGPVNMCGPASVTNAEFTKALGRAVHRPAPWPVPAIVLSKTAGEMADEMLLQGQNVVPGVLNDSGFEFRHPTLDSALAHAVGKEA